MQIALTIVGAIGLGIAWVVVVRRTRVKAPAPPADPTARGPAEAALLAYREARYDDVIASAPSALAALGHDPASERWRARLELLVGHSFFQRDQFDEAIPHLEAGLTGNGRPSGEERGREARLTGEARFAHCLGYAYQRTGRPDQARSIYRALLADDDLDPAVRDGVALHLAQLDDDER